MEPRRNDLKVPDIMTNEQAIIITRVSTDEQEGRDQLPDCRRFCKERGWEVARELQEVQSAWRTYVPRKKFDDALEYARKQKIPHVVFWDIDRYWRNRKLALEGIREYAKMGIKLHFVRQAYLEDLWKIPEPWSAVFYDIMLNLLSALAQEESDKRSARVKKAFQSGKYPNWGKHGIGYSDEAIIKVYRREGSLRKARLKLPYKTHSGKKKYVSIAKISQVVRTT